MQTKPNQTIPKLTQPHQTQLIHTKLIHTYQTHLYETKLNLTKPNSSTPNQTKPASYLFINPESWEEANSGLIKVEDTTAKGFLTFLECLYTRELPDASTPANLGYAFYLGQKYSVDFVTECAKQKLKWFIRTLRDKPRNIVLETIFAVQTTCDPDLVKCWVAGTRRIVSRLIYSGIAISLDKTLLKAMLVPHQV